MRGWKSLLAGGLALVLTAGPVLAYDQEQSRRDPSNDLSVLIAPNTRQFPSDL